MRSIAIGLLGAGNVGCGVVRILEENQDAIAQRVGARIAIKRVLLRHPGARRATELPAAWKTTDPAEVLDDPDIRVVVEVMGGLEPARAHVLQALRNRKHVVSANKALLGTHGRELFAEALRRGVSIHFEASVAGGIPILRILREGLASDRIDAVTGIVNGTSNYVLDAMTRTGARYEDALAEAQAAGFAEADPTMDVSGQDSAQKLALLALVAFGIRVDPTAIPTEGISRIRELDIAAARDLGCVVKSIAVAQRVEGGLRARVHPAHVPFGNVLAGVHGSYNAVLVESRALGRSLYYGRGAGMMPTGSAVVSDIVEVCRAVVSFSDRGPPTEALSSIVDAQPLGTGDERHENYLSVQVPNVPGVLGRVAGCLGAHGISIKRVNQDPRAPDVPVDMVIVTEAVQDARITAALAELDGFDTTLAPALRLRILPQDPLD
ncbi:MAG TPA: homoserine dehydrogenase [Nannocystaceae bacterium]|nr:homoserine dehydrogenase [Nannocystaceae bacterium]